MEKNYLIEFHNLFYYLPDVSLVLANSDPNRGLRNHLSEDTIEKIKTSIEGLKEFDWVSMFKEIKEKLRLDGESGIKEIIRNFAYISTYLDVTAKPEYYHPKLITPNLSSLVSQEETEYQIALGSLKLISKYKQKQITLKDATIIEQYVIQCYEAWFSFVTELDAVCIAKDIKLPELQEQINIFLIKQRPIKILISKGYESDLKGDPWYKKYKLTEKHIIEPEYKFFLNYTTPIEEVLTNFIPNSVRKDSLYQIFGIAEQILYDKYNQQNYLFDFINEKIQFTPINGLLDLFSSELSSIQAKLQNFNADLDASIKYEMNRFNNYYTNCIQAEYKSDEPNYLPQLEEEQKRWIEVFLYYFFNQKESSNYLEILNDDTKCLPGDDYVKYPRFNELIECIRTIDYYQIIFDLYHQELKEKKTENNHEKFYKNEEKQFNENSNNFFKPIFNEEIRSELFKILKPYFTPSDQFLNFLQGETIHGKINFLGKQNKLAGIFIDLKTTEDITLGTHQQTYDFIKNTFLIFGKDIKSKQILIYLKDPTKANKNKFIDISI